MAAATTVSGCAALPDPEENGKQDVSTSAAAHSPAHMICLYMKTPGKEKPGEPGFVID